MAGLDAPYVFLSYASTDYQQALAVADALEAAGIRVWIDREAIAGGTSWGSEIVEGIERCAVLIVLCSRAAMQSRNVKQEIQLAWRFEKPYLPLLRERVEFPQQVLYFLEGWQWVELLDRPQQEWLPVVLKALARMGVANGKSQIANGEVAAVTPPAPILGSLRSAQPNPAGGTATPTVEGAISGGGAAALDGGADISTLGGQAAPDRTPSPSSTDYSPLTTHAPLPAAFPFVGREHELTVLRRAVAEALDGRGQLVMLAGEPGIGKTRLAQRAAGEAAQQGALVLWGRCWEDEGAPAYFPWAEVVRAYLRAVEPDVAARDLAASGAEIAQIVPELRALLPDLPPLPPQDPDQARFQLFAAVTAWLRAAAARRPVVLVLDDLHWADKPSLLLLQFLMRDLAALPLLVLCTYRDVELDRRHPLSQALAALRREPVHERLLLQGLTERETADLVSAAGRQQLETAGEAFAAALHRETEGNPFFIQETLHHLVESGGLVQQQGRWRALRSIAELGIPEGVREVVGRRLSRLSEPCNALLSVAAVIGREFGVATLQRVSGRSEDEVYGLLEEADAARIIAEAPGSGRFRFAHALIRETLYEELTTLRRVRLHRQVGETLEQQYARNVEPHLAELAYHFLEAAAGGDPGKAVEFSTRAGDAALARFAYEDAIAHYTRALGVLEQDEENDEEGECDLLLKLAEAQRLAGDRQSAGDAAWRAAGLARAHGDAQRLARTALEFASDRTRAWQLIEPVVTLLEEALAAVGEGDSPKRALLMGQLGVAIYYSDQAEHRRELLDGALSVARRLNESALLCEALRFVVTGSRGGDQLEERRRLIEELLTMSRNMGDRLNEAWACFTQLLICLAQGDMLAHKHALAELARLADELHSPANLGSLVATHTTVVPLLQGRFAEAKRLAETAMDASRRAGYTHPDAVLPQRQLETAGMEQGEFEGLLERRRFLAESFPAAPIFRCGLARLLRYLDRRDEARQQFDILAENDFAGLRQDPGELVDCLALLGEVCAYLGDGPRAAVLYEQLSPYAEQQVMYSGGHVAFGSCHRFLGLLAATLERWDAAEAHFGAALAFNEMLGARPWVAHTRADYARMLATRDHPGDTDKARELLDAALADAQEMGMKPLAGQVSEALEGLQT